MRPHLHLLAFVIGATFTTVAGADFSSAITAYEKQQFDSAYTEFRRLAELGDAPSQRNLAAMYARGEHVAKDLVEGWAWAALAAEQDSDQATKIRDSLTKKLDDAAKAQAQQRLLELQQQFGRDAIASRLLPVPADRTADCTVSGDGPAQPIKTRPPRYPSMAAQDGVTGFVCMTFYIDSEGKPRRATVYESGVHGTGKEPLTTRRYQQEFLKNSRAALADWQFLPPANEKLRESPARYCLDYKLGASNNETIEARNPKKTRAKIAALAPLVDGGDGKAQYELATLLNTELHPGEKRRAELARYSEQLYLNSAINGDARGQYKLASKLLTGDRCEKDTQKGILWLTLSAQQGNAEAAWLLAQKLDDGSDVAKQTEKSLKWLKIAADGGHPRAKLQYALALMENDASRLAEANTYLPVFEETDDITLLEAYARLAALFGDFDNAVLRQAKVVDIATELSFSLPQRQQVLSAYRNKIVPATASL